MAITPYSVYRRDAYVGMIPFCALEHDSDPWVPFPGSTKSTTEWPAREYRDRNQEAKDEE